MVDEAKDGNLRQIGVQTWLNLESRFDSLEMARSRQKLARKLYRYNSSLENHDSITDEVLELFESIATVYNEGFLSRKLAASSFGFHASGYWKLAQGYIEEERERNQDPKIFEEFESFAMKMLESNPNIDLEKFVKDEANLSDRLVQF
jgi:hypothetical protein